MSSLGNPYRNAQAESFMKPLKVEDVYLAGYESFDDVATRLPSFIEDVYNAKRKHSVLGDRSPNEFDTPLAQQADSIRRPQWSSLRGSLQTAPKPTSTGAADNPACSEEAPYAPPYQDRRHSRPRVVVARDDGAADRSRR
jgi:putative transposase